MKHGRIRGVEMAKVKNGLKLCVLFLLLVWLLMLAESPQISLLYADF
jgi:hypothetical protein